MAAAMALWLSGAKASPMSWSKAQTTVSSSAPSRSARVAVLQRVRVAIHLIAEPVAAQGLEQPQQRVRNALAAIGVQRREESVFLGGAVRHAREGDFPHERLAVTLADAAARLRRIRML